MQDKSFKFNFIWREAIADCPADVRLEVYEAIIAYAETGDESYLSPLAATAFFWIKRQIDIAAAKRAAARRKRAENARNKRQKSEQKSEHTPEPEPASAPDPQPAPDRQPVSAASPSSGPVESSRAAQKRIDRLAGIPRSTESPRLTDVFRSLLVSRPPRLRVRLKNRPRHVCRGRMSGL